MVYSTQWIVGRIEVVWSSTARNKLFDPCEFCFRYDERSKIDSTPTHLPATAWNLLVAIKYRGDDIYLWIFSQMRHQTASSSIHNINGLEMDCRKATSSRCPLRQFGCGKVDQWWIGLRWIVAADCGADMYTLDFSKGPSWLKFDSLRNCASPSFVLTANRPLPPEKNACESKETLVAHGRNIASKRFIK